MKLLQNKFVQNLPKVILFSIAFYNFVWIVWQNKLHSGIACVGCPWFITDSFPIESFLLLIAAYLLFIPRIWSYLISVLTSGYFTISWGLMLVKWFWITDYSQWIEVIKIQYFDNPLQIWESQFVLAIMIFMLAIYNLIKKNPTRIMP